MQKRSMYRKDKRQESAVEGIQKKCKVRTYGEGR